MQQATVLSPIGAVKNDSARTASSTDDPLFGLCPILAYDIGSMAKRQSAPGSLEKSVEDFAEDLGRLLGTARAKAEGWLGQRTTVAKQLAQIRDTAADLLQQLTGGARQALAGRRRGRPRKQAQGPRATASGASPRRTMSAKARKAISEAQKKRWAKRRAEKQ
jgi:hypothetical protein